jgi:two-component system nitrate/nitrite response regulator NarL
VSLHFHCLSQGGIIVSGRLQCLIVIASPAARTRRRWKAALRKKYALCAAAGQNDLNQILKKLSPSVVLLDLALLEGDFCNLHEIKRRSSSSKMILLSDATNEKEELLAIKAGASGYCSKNIDPVLLKKAVEIVQKGEIWIGRHVVSDLVRITLHHEVRNPDLPCSSGSELDSLTFREREIASLIAQVASNKEIADRLSITEATVKAHLTAIFRKLGLSGRLGLALFVSGQNGLSQKGS